MKRFFVKGLSHGSEAVSLRGKELHHLKKVLRLKRGDTIIVFDGKGLELSGTIDAIGKKEAKIIIKNRVVSSRESNIVIILCQGIAKGEKMEMIIQKATELGVARVIPFITRRVVPKLKGEKAAKKTERWRQIAIEAAKQCGRSVVPEVEEPTTLTALLKAWPIDSKDRLGIIPWEGETRTSLNDVLRSKKPSVCVVLTGPEGGFEEEEVLAAKNAGFIPVALGPRILRTETAAIIIAAVVQYELGDMGRLEKP